MLKRLPIIVTLLSVMAFIWPVSPLAAATNPVSVALGGTGSASWSITGIAPGDSGNKSVTVQNTGTGTGELRIWLSNITGTEGTPAGFETPTPGDTGELAQYLELKVLGSGLSSNLTMPALLTDFPVSAADTSYIKATLVSGQTINLTWTWSLPASTGNIVQGDGLSFTINYTLNEVAAPPTTTTTPPTSTEPPAPPVTTAPPTTSVPPTTTAAPTTTPPTTTVPPVTSATPTTAPPTESPSREISIKIFGSPQIEGTITADGRLQNTLIAASNDGDVTLAFPAGISLATDDGEPLAVIDIAIYTGVSPSLLGQTVVGSIYELTGYDASGHLAHFSSDVPFLLSLPFQQPQTTGGTVYIAYFDAAANRWEKLPSFESGDGHVQALLNHFSLYAVLADVSPAPPVPAAAFVIGSPTVQPASVVANKPVTISAVISNSGDASGEFLVHALIPGLLDTTQLVTLAPGASQELSFTVVPQVAGNYAVTIGDKQATFAVSPAAGETGGVRSFIRGHMDAYIGYSIVLVLSLGLIWAVLFVKKRAPNT
jgi:hypothetical protein